MATKPDFLSDDTKDKLADARLGGRSKTTLDEAEMNQTMGMLDKFADDINTEVEAATTAIGALPTLGTAATKDFGTSANQLVELDGSAKLPAVDGSALLNLPGGGTTVVDGAGAAVTGAFLVSAVEAKASGFQTINFPASVNNVQNIIIQTDDSATSLAYDATAIGGSPGSRTLSIILGAPATLTWMAVCT